MDQDDLNMQLVNACSKGDLEQVKALISQGADVHAYGNEAFIKSVGGGHLEVLKHVLKNTTNLIENNEDFNFQAIRGLVTAAINGNLEIVKFLLDYGVSIHSQEGRVLIEASYSGHLEVVSYLLGRGADIHAQEDLALTYATRNKHIKIVHFLVGQGANVHAQNDNALSIASRNGYLELAQYFIINHDCDPKQALKDAKKHKQIHIVEWCKSYIKSKKLKDKLNNKLPTQNEIVKNRKKI